MTLPIVPGIYLYFEPGGLIEQVEVVESAGVLVARFNDMEPGDEDAVPIADMSGDFQRPQ
jgi:hypothetical protein